MLKTLFVMAQMSIALALVPQAAEAQSYPSHPVRIITTDVGGSNDSIARLLARGLTDALGQPVIVENRPSGVIPNETVVRAAPDGHTLLLTGSSMWMGTLFQDMPYDPLKDFTPVALISQDANVLLAHPSLPVNNVQELVDYAKAHPGELNYASTSIGGSMHLAAEMLKSLGKIDVVRINYKGGSQARTDLMAGNVQIGIIGADNAVPLAATGKLKALGVSTLKPSALVPGVTPIADTLPGYEVVGFTALLAPPGTPGEVVERLNTEIAGILASDETKQQLLGLNQEIVGGDAAALKAKMEADISKWSVLVKEAGLKAQ